MNGLQGETICSCDLVRCALDRKDNRKQMKREIIEAAILGFEIRRQRIDATIAGLKAQLGGSTAAKPSASSSEPKTKTKRKMSAAGRVAISAATKQRWAE